MKDYLSKNFLLTITQKKDFVYLTQQIFHPAVHTDMLPGTHFVLAKTIPSIFENQCFNEKNLPFEQEVKNTECGHLFEHLLLESLKIETLKKNNYADYEGKTCWDWNHDKYGSYQIFVNSPRSNKHIFYRSLIKSVFLFEQIYNFNFEMTN